LAGRGDFEKAITEYRAALAIQPRYFSAHLNLARQLAARRPFAEAIAQYRKALAIARKDPVIQYEFGVALAAHEELDEAIEHFREALNAKPDYAAAHAKLAAALVARGQFGEAMTHYRASLALDPSLMEVQNNLAWLLATCPEPSLRNGAQAVELAEQATHRSRVEQAGPLDTLAAAYAEAGRFPEAVATARRALKLATRKYLPDLAKKLRERIALYQARKPFHEGEERRK
jgi:tetratricopeptide (TPR) repeat protein